MKRAIVLAIAVAATAPAHAADPVSIVPKCEGEKLVAITIGTEQIAYPRSPYKFGGKSTDAMKTRIKAALGRIDREIVFDLTAGQSFSCISGLDMELEDMRYRNRQYKEKP